MAVATLITAQTVALLTVIAKRDPVFRHILRHPFTPYREER